MQRLEFLHLAWKPSFEEASTVRVPFVIVKDANPLGIWISGSPDVNNSRSGASVIAALVMFHGLEGPHLFK